jgi:hypothetical protein
MLDIDRVALSRHIEALHALAAPLAGIGKLVVACFGEDPDATNPKTGRLGRPLPPQIKHLKIGGGINENIRVLCCVTEAQHYNAYMPLAVLREDLGHGRKGEESDIEGVLGFVADFDDDDATKWARRLPIPPSYVMETSAGRFRAFYLLDNPASLDLAKPIAERLRAFAGCDYGTADCSHVWRVAGTLNWPNARKIGAGRVREPQLVKVVRPWDKSTVSLANLAEALKSPMAQRLNTGGRRDGVPEAELIKVSPETAPCHEIENDNMNVPRAMVETVVKVLPRGLRDRITRSAQGDRSRDLYHVINGLIARGLDDATIERIIRHYSDGIGAKYADRGDLDREIARIRVKGSRRATPEHHAAPSDGHRPIIEVHGGELPFVVDQAEAALMALDLEIYEFGDELVRPAIQPVGIADNRSTPGLRLVSVGMSHLIERFTRVADFRRFDKRSGKTVSIDCPKLVTAAYLERVGQRHLRKLTAVTTCPVLRPDGTVLGAPGFDEQTGIVYDPRGVHFPEIPRTPTRGEALAALAELKQPISEFPFVDGSSRSVVLSGMVTAVARLALPSAPMHGFDAPTAGTGKSKLVDCCSVIATGHEAPVIAQGKTEEEMEKRLGAALIAGDRIISLDNCERPLGGEIICQALTQKFLKLRILGQSKNVMVPNLALYFATGNNLLLTGDMPRRAIVGRLDAGVERPEERQFMIEDPVETLKRERPRYVAASLTLLRAFIVAGQPKQARHLGGFEEWSRLVRDALICACESDPVATAERVREQDPKRAALAAVLAQWNAVIETKRVSAKELIDRATAVDDENGYSGIRRFSHPEFRETLMTIAGDAGNISSRRLGIWLNANKQKIVDGMRIIADGITEGIQRYRLQRLRDGRWE